MSRLDNFVIENATTIGFALGVVIGIAIGKSL